MEIEAEFPPELSSAGAARRLAERTLREWGCESMIGSARLLVSELVVNAVLHARSPAGLLLRRERDGIRVEVHDSSTTMPQRRAYELDATSGRGLMILDALAHTWGVDADADAAGKTVWFELRSAPDPV